MSRRIVAATLFAVVGVACSYDWTVGPPAPGGPNGSASAGVVPVPSGQNCSSMDQACDCASPPECGVDCPGGGCSYECSASECHFDCTGGGCALRCNGENTRCVVRCYGHSDCQVDECTGGSACTVVN